MKVLLVEPNYTIKYPNLALLKLATSHRLKGDDIIYVHGERYVENVDIIYISTLFTYYAEQTIKSITFYQSEYKNAKILVGGVFATLMTDYIKEMCNNVDIFRGTSEELDSLKNDNFIQREMENQVSYLKKWNEFDFLFTSRGCPRKCGFCAVKTLEPKSKIIENWKELMNDDKKYVMIFDNNITALNFEHFKNVFHYLIKKKKVVHFHNGFDVRLLKENQMQLMSKIKWYPGGLRVAFDNMSEEGYFQRTVKRLLDLGVPKSAFLTFTLFNFEDTVEEAMYRCRESLKLGIRPYPCFYRPLDQLNKKILVVGKHWTKELVRGFHSYWYLAGNYKRKSFDEFMKERKKIIKDENQLTLFQGVE